jgi:hypothetical protein
MTSIEIFDQFGNIDVSRIDAETIEGMDETRRDALLILIQAVNVKAEAGDRVAAARRRLHTAMSDEETKKQIADDAAQPIQFSVAALEQSLGRPLNASEMQAAREQWSLRCRQILEQQARRQAAAAYVPQ